MGRVFEFLIIPEYLTFWLVVETFLSILDRQLTFSKLSIKRATVMYSEVAFKVSYRQSVKAVHFDRILLSPIKRQEMNLEKFVMEERAPSGLISTRLYATK